MGSAQCSMVLSPAEKEARCTWVPGFVPGYDSIHEPMNNTATLYLFIALIVTATKFIYRVGNKAVAQVRWEMGDSGDMG